MLGFRAAIQLLFVTCVASQYRGGSIGWERLGDSNVVRFTVKTAWMRTSATFVQVVDGVVMPGDPGYQPKTGDVVNVLGIETPKFATSNGFEQYLQLTVTSHTERQGGGDHLAEDWTYWTTNFIEGISTFDVAFDSDRTYTAELQGCCRMDMMREGESTCVDYFAGQGILKLCNTPYHLRATVNLNLDPPPLSFLPFWVPFRFTVLNNTEFLLQLPVLDFMDSIRIAPSRLPVRDPEGWDSKIRREAEDAFGSLSATASELAPADADHIGGGAGGLGGRRLLDAHEEEENLEPLPPQPAPGKVMATATVTGRSVRMLRNERQMLRLFSTPDCTGNDMIELPPNMDLCNGTDFFPSGADVIANLSCVLVPPGVQLELTDACSVSSPPPKESNLPYSVGNRVHFTDGTSTMGSCSNFYGTISRPCRVNRDGVTFPRMLWTTKEPELSCSLAACALSGTYTASTIPNVSDAVSFLYRDVGDGQQQAFLYLENRLPSANYPVTLMLSTSTSASTMIEFVLHVMDDTYTSKFDYHQTPVSSIRPLPVPTGFPTVISWDFVGDVPPSTLVYNNVNEDLFGGDLPLMQRTDQAPQVSLTWSPCLPNVGLYYVCSSAVAVTDRYIWAPMACVLLRVLEDLAPRITMFDASRPGEDQDHFSLYIGESLEAVVQAFDNPSDTIEFLGVSKVDASTGDRLRGRVSYVYRNVGTPGRPERALMPRLVEPGLPPFLALVVAGPRNASITAETPHMYDRVVSYTPTRMHSGLDFSLCFLSVDAGGVCPKDVAGGARIGSGRERCMQVTVQRCKYALSVGQELAHVGGLFETNWLQLFALNPTFNSPEVPWPGPGKHVVNIGHLYQVVEGETLYDVVRHMGMTENHLRFLNADMSRQKQAWWTETLPEGAMLCVIPNSCLANV